MRFIADCSARWTWTQEAKHGRCGWLADLSEDRDNSQAQAEARARNQALAARQELQYGNVRDQMNDNAECESVL